MKKEVKICKSTEQLKLACQRASPILVNTSTKKGGIIAELFRIYIIIVIRGGKLSNSRNPAKRGGQPPSPVGSYNYVEKSLSYLWL